MGHAPTSEFQYDPSNSNTIASSMQSAVLRFKAAGITHVVTDGPSVGQLMIAANNQGYMPRYGVDSYAILDTALQDNAPKAQLAGAMGIGWNPAIDVDQTRDPGDVAPGEKACLAIMEAAGQRMSGKRFAQEIAFALCDGFHLIQDGAAAGGGLSPADLIAGIRKIGPTFRQSVSFKSGLSATSYSIPGAARDVAWGEACQCFAYSGPVFDL